MRQRDLGLMGLGLALVLAATPARGEIVLTAVQDASGVIISGSGSADTTDLSLLLTTTSPSGVYPGAGSLLTGPAGVDLDIDAYTGLATGPATLGGGDATASTSGSGDAFGAAVEFGISLLILPAGYTSLDPLQGTATIAGATFASLGLTPGTYTWTWGSGDHADSMVLTVVPEPSSLALAAIGVGCGLWTARRRRARAV